MRRLRALGLWFASLVALLMMGVAGVVSPGRVNAAGGIDPLRLVDDRGRIDAWPVVSVLFDPSRRLTIRDVVAAFDRFERPLKAHATLGISSDPVWVHVPVQVDERSGGHWVLDVDYSPLEAVDMYALADGEVIHHAALGSSRPFASRPLQSRTYAMPLELQPGRRYDLVIRAESDGTLILPITLETPTAFHGNAVGEQMLQGVLNGVGLCLLLYSLAQWAVLREPFFLKYCVLISGSLLFSLIQFGIGLQFLWTDHVGIERHAGAASALIALVGSFLFVEQALDEPRRTRTFARTMKAGAAGCGAIAVLYMFDLGIETSTVTTIVSVLGPLPALMGVPGAVRRLRKGDPIGSALMVAWLVYFCTTAMIISVIRGQMPANFWTLHSFQFGATFDMVVFTYVLGLRTKAIRQVAQRASVERDLMHSLAITDPLTGLTNRRGLGNVLAGARARGQSTGLLSLYLIDVDGFKDVNDRHGHEAGDELLIQLSNRLRSAVRGSDIVARLGGDEFVVVADGLSTPELAEELGFKLVAVADEPFALSRHTVQVGLTIGYAVAAADERDPAALLQRADGAMYEGKRAGKHCLRRAEKVPAAARQPPPVTATRA